MSALVDPRGHLLSTWLKLFLMHLRLLLGSRLLGDLLVLVHQVTTVIIVLRGDLLLHFVLLPRLLQALGRHLVLAPLLIPVNGCCSKVAAGVRIHCVQNIIAVD